MDWVNESADDFLNLLSNSIFDEEPVDLDTFLFDKHYLGNSIKIMSDAQKDIVRKMTQVFYLETLQDLYGKEEGQKIWDEETFTQAVLMLGKGCHAPDTPVFNAKTGNWQRLDSFVDYDNTVMGLDGNTLIPEYGTEAFIEGEGELLRVKTSLGFEEVVYLDHKYYVWKKKDFYKRNYRNVCGPKWTEAKFLEKGDKIAIGLGFDVAEPENLPVEHLKFIAYLLGDGMCPTDENPTINVDFGGDERQSLQQYLSCIDYIGDTYLLKKHPNKNMYFVRHGKNSLSVKLAESYGLWGKRAHNKCVPNEVWKCSNELLKEFLGALWSTDGTIYLKKTNSAITPVAEYCSISEQLATDVQRMLLRLGIASSIRSKVPTYTYKGEKRQGQRAYVVTVINNENFLRFAKNITLFDYKQERLLEGLELIRSAKYSQNMIDGNIYWDRVKSIDPAGYGEYWTLTQPHTSNYVSNGFISAQSGKDFTTRVSFARIIYLLHCLKNPVAYYGKAGGTYISLLNIAVNEAQARNVFFQPLLNILKMSPYFMGQGFSYTKREIEFQSKPIKLLSGNSEAEAWEGLDLLVIVLDEIAAFRNEKETSGNERGKLSAKLIYDMSINSVASRFPSVGKVCCLSFPRFRGDPITTLYDESANDPHTFRLKACTWEINPLITREMLEPQFKRNPVEAKTRFMAEPPEAAGAFFRDPNRVRACFRGEPFIVDEGLPTERRLLKEIPDLNPLNENGTFRDWFVGKDGYERYIHVDLAKGTRDRASLVMTHCPGTRKIMVADGIFEHLPVVKMDLIHYWEANDGEEIDFAGIREFVIALSRRFPIGMVTVDHWNSIEFLQTLQKRGIPCQQFSVKKAAYDTLATCFYDGRFSGYFNHQLVENELLKLVLVNDKKVDHIAGEHDDGAYSLAGAVANTCMYMDVGNEIEIDIIGSGDEDWEDFETQEALEEDMMKDGRKNRQTSLHSKEDDDWEFNII